MDTKIINKKIEELKKIDPKVAQKIIDDANKIALQSKDNPKEMIILLRKSNSILLEYLDKNRIEEISKKLNN